VFVKICGITNPADAEAIISARADALGSIFGPEASVTLRQQMRRSGSPNCPIGSFALRYW